MVPVWCHHTGSSRDATDGLALLKIVNIECDFLLVSVPIPIRETPTERGVLLVTLESDTGLRGFGLAQERDYHALGVRQIVLNDIAPFLMRWTGSLAPPAVWHAASFEIPGSRYGLTTDLASRASSAVDQALWDLWGQTLGEPVYRLLGGAQPEIAVYATFGLNIYTPDEEEEAARRLLAEGYSAFKIQGSKAEAQRDIRRDAARIARIRETIGDGPELILDGQNNSNLYEAIALARLMEPHRVAFFDEPLYAKDPVAMRQLRQACPTVPIAGRGRGGNIWDNRDLITGGAVDVMGSNVLDQGGFTQSMKVAHLAEMYQLPVVTGGAWHLQNAHLIAAIPNGWMTEYHGVVGAVSELVFEDSIKPRGGRLRLSDRPGLGLRLNDSAVREAKERGHHATQSRR
jgi:L-rhamnonate dehydratase